LHGFCTVAQLDDKGLHIRRRVCAKLEPENVLALYHQLSQTLYTIPGHACLLSAREQTLDNVRQFLWASLPYVYSMVIYWDIIRNVAIEKSLLLQARKLYVEMCYALLRMRPLSISWAECSVVISCGKVDYDKSG
jgi:hypothetical protein